MFPSRFGAALTGLLLTAVAPLHAQSIPSPYRYIEEGQEGGLFVGTLSPDRGRFGFGPAPALGFGARYAVELAGPLALEGVWTVLPTTRDVINPARPEGDRKIDEAEVFLNDIDVRLRFDLTGRRTWHAVQPFLLAGGGVAFDAAGTQVEDQPLEAGDRFDFGTKFTGVFGGGFRIMLPGHFVLRADASLSLWKLNYPDGYRDPERGFENVPNSEWVNNGALTLGLAYRW